MKDEVKKAIKRERRRLSKRKREIREEVKGALLRLVEEKVKSFRRYLDGWCGPKEEGEEEKAANGEGL